MFWEIFRFELLGLVRYECDALYAFGTYRVRDRLDRDRAVDRLAARHCHGVVVENLKRDVGICRDGLANCQ